MRRRHFEALRPVCPACRAADDRCSPLLIAWVKREEREHLIEGALQCSDPSCLSEYPIIDGIPILLPDARHYIAQHFVEIVARDDLSHDVASLLVECCGPASTLDAIRQSQGQYAWDHYGDLDPAYAPTQPAPGGIVRVLESALSLLPDTGQAPILDAGCSVGRTTFELAQRSTGLVLGLDNSFTMLRLASRVLRDARVSYSHRRVGLIYDPIEFPVSFAAADRVDFWLADASVLPFETETFGTTVALNLLDCVPSPLDLLRALCQATRPGGHLLLGSPYDWSGAVTAPGAWIGGHSQRAPGAGRSEAVLRSLLETGRHTAALEHVRQIGELADLPWHVRLHDRSFALYRIHVLAAEILSRNGS